MPLGVVGGPFLQNYYIYQVHIATVNFPFGGLKNGYLKLMSLGPAHAENLVTKCDVTI
jgi:hypothetical protein